MPLGEEVVQNCSPTNADFVLNIARRPRWQIGPDLVLLGISDGLLPAHFLCLEPNLGDQSFRILISQLQLGFLGGKSGFEISHLKRKSHYFEVTNIRYSLVFSVTSGVPRRLNIASVSTELTSVPGVRTLPHLLPSTL